MTNIIPFQPITAGPSRAREYRRASCGNGGSVIPTGSSEPLFVTLTVQQGSARFDAHTIVEAADLLQSPSFALALTGNLVEAAETIEDGMVKWAELPGEGGETYR